MPSSSNHEFQSSSTFMAEERKKEKSADKETVSLTVNSSLSDTQSKAKITDFQLLQPQQIIGGCYQVIKPLNLEAFFKRYLIKDIQNKHNPLLVLEFVCDENAPSTIITENAFLTRVALIKKLSSHVQIPKLLSHGVENKQYYLVYEYCEGKIIDSISKYHTFTELEIVNYIQDIARIYDFFIKGNITNCELHFYNILKSKANDRYILGNFKNIFFNLQTNVCPVTKKQQTLVFQEKIRDIGIAVVQLSLKQHLKNSSTAFKIPANWRRQVGLSPQLQTILSKMIASDSNCYESFQQLVNDLKPLVKIQQIIGNKYRLIRYLGENDGIKTYLARNVADQKNSPLLIVKQSILLERDSNFIKAEIDHLKQEFEKIKRLQIFKTNDLITENFEDYQEIYLVRDYIEGISLGKKINNQVLLEPQEIVILLKEILKKIAVFHKENLIHRNLKLTNIILAKENQSFILVDFGILQAIDKINSNKNENYQNRQPPEQIVGRPTVSSDIYSLGIIFIEILNQLSVNNFSSADFLKKEHWQIKIIEYPFLIEIIEKMICLDVDKRYQSTSEVSEDLNKVVKTDIQTIKGIEKPHNKYKNFKNIILGVLSAFCLIGGLEIAFPIIRPHYYVQKGRNNLFKQPKTALIDFDKALKIEEKKVAAWKGKGTAFLELQEFDKALEAYEKVIEINPKSISGWQGKGNVLFQLGNLNKALESYNKSLEIEPENVVSLGKKAKILYFSSRYQEALSIQEKARNIQPLSDTWLLKDFADSSIALKKYNQALSVLNIVHNIAPSEPYLWQNKVIVLRNLNRSLEAFDTAKKVLESYDNAIKKQPNNIDLLLGKAEFLKQLKRYSQALESYQQAIAIKPDSHAAWLGKSKTLLTIKEFSKAFETVEKALEIQPQSFQAWHTRGLILQQARLDLQEAIASYDKSIAINPDFFPSWRDRGVLFITKKDYSQAIQSLQKAVALAPHDIESWLYLSDTFENIQKTEEALRAIDKAVNLQPRNSSHWLKKGSLKEKQQDYSEACNIYRQAMTIAPDWKITDAMQKLGCRSS